MGILSLLFFKPSPTIYRAKAPRVVAEKSRAPMASPTVLIPTLAWDRGAALLEDSEAPLELVPEALLPLLVESLVALATMLAVTPVPVGRESPAPVAVAVVLPWQKTSW